MTRTYIYVCALRSVPQASGVPACNCLDTPFCLAPSDLLAFLKASHLEFELDTAESANYEVGDVAALKGSWY